MNKQQVQGALTGVRILDMATVLAAPSGSTYCADHGADVVKLELPDGSDALRTLQPVKDGKALWWKVANRGKRGITLDVRTPRGREIFLNAAHRVWRRRGAPTHIPASDGTHAAGAAVFLTSPVDNGRALFWSRRLHRRHAGGL